MKDASARQRRANEPSKFSSRSSRGQDPLGSSRLQSGAVRRDAMSIVARRLSAKGVSATSSVTVRVNRVLDPHRARRE